MKTILIVDDAPENILVLGKHLLRGFEVLAATSGEEALAIARAQRPALILLDVKMPGMDGYQVLSRLKEDPRTGDIPVIFVTADNTAASETDALRSGAADFIHKPVNLDVLESRVALQLALEERKQALRELNESLERKVAERTLELQRAKEVAEAANSAKTNFLRNVSHEMRTPVHQIVGLLELIRMKPGSEKIGEWIANTTLAARRLTAMFDALLAVTELDSRMTTIHVAPIDLRELVEEVVETLRETAHRKELALETSLGDLPGGLLGDASWIRCALLCYLDNAVKFTDHGRVLIAVSVDDLHAEWVALRFTVSDTGAGFGPAVQTRLFNLFEQADNSLTRRYEGSGLGLATVKKIAERLGGSVGCESRPGVGSAFWFSVRLERQR